MYLGRRRHRRGRASGRSGADGRHGQDRRRRHRGPLPHGSPTAAARGARRLARSARPELRRVAGRPTSPAAGEPLRGPGRCRHCRRTVTRIRGPPGEVQVTWAGVAILRGEVGLDPVHGWCRLSTRRLSTNGHPPTHHNFDDRSTSVPKVAGMTTICRVTTTGARPRSPTRTVPVSSHCSLPPPTRGGPVGSPTAPCPSRSPRPSSSSRSSPWPWGSPPSVDERDGGEQPSTSTARTCCRSRTSPRSSTHSKRRRSTRRSTSSTWTARRSSPSARQHRGRRRRDGQGLSPPTPPPT